ncbi:hypothetical protein ACI2KH_23575 [Roseomonas mucosa]|jgi:hypothetical protein|uniref:hypothetical protein n=1 Tax=Roseomonas mucosa TaxID=207340 RepID=UPI00384F47EC
MEIRRLTSRSGLALLTQITPVAANDGITCTRCSTAFGTDPTLAVICPVCRAPEGERCRHPAQDGLHRSHYTRARIALALGCMSPCPALSWDDLHILPVRATPGLFLTAPAYPPESLEETPT